jgi:hypothetical protein
MPMIKPADFDAYVKALGAQERALLFCLASGTDWKQAGVTPQTVAGVLVKFLVKLHWASHQLALTDIGRDALRVLLRDL